MWREWTEPAAFADWFGGTESEVPLASVSMDVRPGGSWRDQPGEEAYELITVVLSDLGDGRTEMLFQQRGRMSAEQYERAGEGWSTFFDRIAERLELVD